MRPRSAGSRCGPWHMPPLCGGLGTSPKGRGSKGCPHAASRGAAPGPRRGPNIMECAKACPEGACAKGGCTNLPKACFAPLRNAQGGKAGLSPLGSGCFGGAGPPKACAKATSVLYVHCVADPTQLSVKWCRARTLRGQRSGPRDQAGPRGVPWHTNMFQRCPLRGYRYHPSSQRGGDIPLAGGGGLGASLVQRSKACPLAHCARGQNGFSRELGQSLPSGGPPGAPKPPHVFSRGGCAPINSPTTFWGGPRPPPKGCRAVYGGTSPS